MQNNTELWQAVLGELELTLSRANFTTWFKNTFISSCENGSVTVGVPNTFTKTWFENKYHKDILKAVKNVTGNEVREVIYNVETQKNRHVAAGTSEHAAPPPVDARTVNIKNTAKAITNEGGLSPRYIFKTFIVGKSNELAHAAAQAIVDRPGEVYNPFFVYGGVGLGKTHLMQAIGNEILCRNNSKNVLYASCERFTNDFVYSIKNGKADDFKKRYRNVDVLLIDDIHFMTGKEQTQEQFFHTFNELHQRNKQIIISSDRPPKALAGLENRLLSRFEWGMIADIAAPDLETRTAIIESKLNDKSFPLDDEIISLIASSIQSNIRELEGVLNRVIAYHQLNHAKPTTQSVRSILNTFTTSPKRGAITAKQLIKIVSKYFDITIEEIVGGSRKKELVIPRQIVMFLMREEIKSSFPNIGAELGGRDHTTAMHAYSKISREVEKNERISQDITLIRQRLYNQSWDNL